MVCARQRPGRSRWLQGCGERGRGVPHPHHARGSGLRSAITGHLDAAFPGPLPKASHLAPPMPPRPPPPFSRLWQDLTTAASWAACFPLERAP